MSTCGSRTEGKFYRKTNVYLMKKSTDTFQILSSYNVTTSGYHSPLSLPYHSESTCFLGVKLDSSLLPIGPHLPLLHWVSWIYCSTVFRVILVTFSFHIFYYFWGLEFHYKYLLFELPCTWLSPYNLISRQFWFRLSWTKSWFVFLKINRSSVLSFSMKTTTVHSCSSIPSLFIQQIFTKGI